MNTTTSSRLASSRLAPSRLALYAAALAAAGWGAKAVAIGVAGGPGESPLEGPLFFAGLIAFVVAVVSLGVALTPGRPGWQRAIVGVAAFAVGLGFTQAVVAVLAAVQPADASWVWSELNLWVVAPLALLAAWLVGHRSGRADPR